MKVEITQDCAIAPEGHTTIHVKKGEIVEGAIAEFVLKHRLGKKLRSTAKPDETKPFAGPDTKKTN